MEHIAEVQGEDTSSKLLGLTGLALIIVGVFIVLQTTLGVLGVGKPSDQELISLVTTDDVRIVYTDDERNCGSQSEKGLGVGGCFSSATPNTIYISPGASFGLRQYLILHEGTHYLQFRDGRDLDECEADRNAKKLGASMSFSSYKECS